MSWYNSKQMHQQSIEEREFNKATLLVSLQAEIETNLISLNVRYRNYSKSISDNDEINIREFKQLDKVFLANLNRLGNVEDVALVAEIVGFYRGLQMLENWTDDFLARKYSQQDAENYVSQIANYLHASIYLHARIKELTSNYSNPLSDPVFSEDRKRLLQEITNLRKKLSVRTKKSTLNFS